MQSKALLITSGIVVFIAAIIGAYYFGQKSKATNPEIEKVTLPKELGERANNRMEETYEIEKSPEELRSELEQIESENTLDYLTVESFKTTPDLFGKKMLMNVKVKNNASVATYKDVVLRFHYFSKTNSSLGTTEKTVYEFFPPGKEFQVAWSISNPKGVRNSSINRLQCNIAKALSVPRVEF